MQKNKIYIKKYFLQKYEAVFNFDSIQKCFLSSKSAYYYDFWRSCDTEDWSNDAENSAAHHRNKFHFTIYYNINKLFSTNISQYYCFYHIFICLSEHYFRNH